ncbi:MAG: beta-ketoacyl-[acyl-carrier-protein] synthase family protein [Acidobacteria bacterium]|nr:beta-ketoacyl-[acyl-carrier-protein] synthase family protein [Acidobacteriota bacterium]
MPPTVPRVAITGIGVVSPFGVGRERFWSAVAAGESGTRAIDAFDAAAYPCQVAAALPLVTVDDVPPVPGDDETSLAAATGSGARADPKRYARVSLAAVVAAREAWNDAGLRIGEPGAGVILGTGAGGIDVGERQYREFFAGDPKRVTPYAIPVSICGMVSSEVSISLRLHGVSHVLSTGCTSSTDAVGYAAALLRSGDAEVVLSGGADACVTPGMIYGFSRMRVMATRFNDRPAEASRPFDRDRDGFVLGEGAYLLVLETEHRARRRGARVYAFVDGYGSTCDAYHRVQMDPDGTEIVRAMRLAIDRAGKRVDDIGYVNYHGTSTPLNDAVEARTVRRLLGARADAVPGSSIKSMIGHPQGASGAAGVVATALALHRGFLPPTINLRHPDPACDLDFIANVGRPAEVATALCNCLGFGSKNSALVLGASR